jgi:hypothetical protein
MEENSRKYIHFEPCAFLNQGTCKASSERYTLEYNQDWVTKRTMHARCSCRMVDHVTALHFTGRQGCSNGKDETRVPRGLETNQQMVFCSWGGDVEVPW